MNKKTKILVTIILIFVLCGINVACEASMSITDPFNALLMNGWYCGLKRRGMSR